MPPLEEDGQDKKATPVNPELLTQHYEKLRELGLRLASLIGENCPDSREKSLAITKLELGVEEAIMWANASIARNE